MEVKHESDNKSGCNKIKKSYYKCLIIAMKEMPYTEITVKDILTEAKVTRRTFYRNFDNMDDLLHSTVETVSQELFKVLQNEEYIKSPRVLSKDILIIVSKHEDIFMAQQRKLSPERKEVSAEQPPVHLI